MSKHKAAYIVALAGFVTLGCADSSPGIGNAQDTLPGAAVASQASVAPTCQVAPGSRELPEEIRETSGLARGRKTANLLWTHNDGNRPELYGVDATGTVLSRVRVEGIELEDWEDLGTGPCASGDCLYLADTGDNSGERSHVTVYRIAEPDAGVSSVSGADALQARFPDGRWDTEAIFVTAEGAIHLVTKGREGPVALYRFPTTAGPGGIMTLERVRELFPAGPANEDRITGAAISPDGRWVGIRSNSSLYFYPAETLLAAGGQADPVVIDLRPLGEPQGESLSIDADGTVWLTSEAENRDTRPMLSSIRCTFPA